MFDAYVVELVFQIRRGRRLGPRDSRYCGRQQRMTSDKKLQDIYSNFVTASTSNVFSYPKHVSEKNTGQLGRMSGEEAKSFYEDVVCNDKYGGHSYDKPQDNHHRIVTQRTTSSSSICEQSSARKPAPQEKRSKTVSKVFRYAQEGNLSELKKALYSARHSPVDINVKDKFLWTPLMCSAHAGHASVVNFLLGEGAVWRNTCDQKGNSALDLARLAGHSDVETILLEHEKLKKDSGALFRAAAYPSKTKCNKKFWCSHCQQEFTEDKRKHEASTAHLFNCQHKSKKTIYAIPESSIGYQMMITSGWDAEKGECQ